MHESVTASTTSRKSHPRGYRSEEEGRSSTSGISSCGSVDAILIEQFPATDSDPSLDMGRSMASDCGKPSNQAFGWMSKAMSRATRVISKRRARRLFSQLIGAEELGDGQAALRKRRRYEAARGLAKISNNEGGGAKVVARLFLKRTWRREEGIEALLRLSDDELEEFGYKAIGHVTEPIFSTKLLATIMNHTRDSVFFSQCISTALTGGHGTAAILHLAITETRSFFAHITSVRLFIFCKQVIENEEQTGLKWYCGAKLVCMFLASPFVTEWKHSQLLQLLLPVFEGLVERWMGKLRPGGLERAKKDGADADPSLLAMIAVCGDHLAPFQDRAALPLSSNLKPFLESLIFLLHPNCSGRRRLNMDHGIALYILLAQPPQVVNLLPGPELSSIGALFLDMVFHPWIFEIPTKDAVEKDMLKMLARNLEQWCISGLCCLPRPTFETALASTLKQETAQLTSPDPPDYDVEQIHWTLVEADTCTFLTYVLSYNMDQDPPDRGLWRAKGLAMTCLGNIIERMDAAQLDQHVTEEMVRTVVSIKNHEDVPTVQKGQAIFTLQRYTLAADRWSIRPFYREDPSNMEEEFRNADEDDPQAPWLYLHYI